MKTKLKVAAFYFLAVILGGCVPSLHPLFTEDQQVFDSNLVGVWMSDSNEIWEFRPGEKNYECIYIDKDGQSGKFDGRLGKLGKSVFLDIYPKELHLSESGFYKMHFVPAHTFLRVQLTKDSLNLRVMNPENFVKLAESEPNAVKCEKLENDTYVMTASTKQLQQFMLKYGLDEKYGLFGCPQKGDRMRRTNAVKSNNVNDTE